MKSILVPIGGSDTDASVFETALLVARLFSSHLQFLHIQIVSGGGRSKCPAYRVRDGPRSIERP